MDQPRRSPDDQYLTETSDLQAETESILLKHLPLDPESPPPLQRQQHLQFIVRSLLQGFSSRYISQDASQPWLLYWTLQSFCALGVVLDPDNKQRCASPFAHSLIAHFTCPQRDRQDSGVAASRGWVWRWTRTSGTSPPHLCVCLLTRDRWQTRAERRLGPDQQVCVCPSPLPADLTHTHRDKLYRFLMSLKQPDGSFLVAHHAEVDVR